MPLPIAAAMADSPLSDVRARIGKAAALAGRRPDDIVLIAIAKTQSADAVAPLIVAGQRDFGENRVQEAQEKWPELCAEHPDLRLHLVGRLQSNKAEDAVRLFDAIHSLDRPSLAAALAKAMERTGRRPLASSRSISATSRKRAVAPSPTCPHCSRRRGNCRWSD